MVVGDFVDEDEGAHDACSEARRGLNAFRVAVKDVARATYTGPYDMIDTIPRKRDDPLVTRQASGRYLWSGWAFAQN